jgi:hypothetical protein
VVSFQVGAEMFLLAVIQTVNGERTALYVIGIGTAFRRDKVA